LHYYSAYELWKYRRHGYDDFGVVVVVVVVVFIALVVVRVRVQYCHI